MPAPPPPPPPPGRKPGKPPGRVARRDTAGQPTIGADVSHGAVLEVAARLLVEGAKNLEAAPESALVALKQARIRPRAHARTPSRLARQRAARTRSHTLTPRTPAIGGRSLARTRMFA